MRQPRKYLNHLELKQHIFGNEERYKLLKDTLDKGTFLPKTVDYKDIDEAFNEWVNNSLKISYNDRTLPTMVLYSNQRFTEYSQTWKYTDENNNLILNFKTVTRENNPQYGQIQSGLWNIPGNRFYLMKKQIVLDDNGSESVLALKMRQPMAIDFHYFVSIYATNIETINTFNRIVNDRFKARQDYISPNGYYMPMILDNITDKSSYEIDDRQFYSQSYDIKLMGFVLTEDDFKVEEQPLKIGLDFKTSSFIKQKADIEIDEYDNPCNAPENEEEYYPKPINIIIKFPSCVSGVTFDIDTNLIVDDIVLDNIKRNYQIVINDEKFDNVIGNKLSDGDEISIKITHIRDNELAIFKIIGHSTDIAYSIEKDEPEIDADATQYEEEIDIEPTEN